MEMAGRKEAGMLRKHRRFFLTVFAGSFALLCILATSPASATSQKGVNRASKSLDDEGVVRLGVDLVSLNITVTDGSGRFIRGLDEEAFDVYEDKVKQQVTHFRREDTPISLGIVFDVSGSMKDKIGSAHAALREFLNVCRDDDDIFSLGFNEQPRMLHDYTPDDGAILGSIATLQPKGMTAVIDAVFLSLEKLREGKYARHAILLISDGQDNSSRYTMHELKEAVREADVQIYCIGVSQINGPQADIDIRGFETLAELAQLTGGEAYYPRTPAELESVCNYIAFELRSQYSLGYESTNLARDGKWRDVRVHVRVPKSIDWAAVRCRTGYYALGAR